MKIFSKEIEDGIAELVQSSASVAYCMPASLASDKSSSPTSKDFID